MADNVQFILDRMSSMLQRMAELEVFTSVEIKSIVKKTTDYEYVLKRRQLKPSDFYGYLEYEINLDKLRSIRCATKGAGNKEKQDAFRVLDGVFVKHISYIFDRAIRRFPSEYTLWADYIAFLKERKAVSALNAVFGKALSLNPKNEDFWMQAAVHELDTNNNIHAARTLLQVTNHPLILSILSPYINPMKPCTNLSFTVVSTTTTLLQRSLRANKTSQQLWCKYFELELWNAVRINERQR